MTDILPKNPHSPESCVMSSVQALHECGKWEGWEECQDETMKALRPILEECIELLQEIFEQYWADSEVLDMQLKLMQLLGFSPED